VGDVPIPRYLSETAQAEGRSGWLATLPQTVADMAARWSLTIGVPFEPGGTTAWVAPVTHASGVELVLKVCWRHTEARDEAEGLQVWDGDGAVRVYESTDVDDGIALLLERCLPGTTLSGRPEPEQDVVVADLLRRLWRHTPPADRFRPLAQMCDEWADGYEKKSSERRAVLDPGLAREGMALWRALPESAEESVLLCTDLHAQNVLAADREPWLVIDPKPYVGDPTYDVLQHLYNCERRLTTDPEALIERMAGLLDLDRDRLRLWLFARCVQESPDWPAAAGLARRLAPPGP
jgi:streptomycin 6-kinase